MTLWNWFLGLFNHDGTLNLTYAGELTTELFYKQLAVQACVNLIAGTVSRSEFQTFEKGIEVKRNNYYLFNVEPNQNYSASKFWRKVISKLVYDNECLVIQQNGLFYIADSFTPKKYAFLENTYADVVIEDYRLSKTFYESEVFHFELHNEKIRTIIDGMYLTYSKLIAASQNNYRKSKARRGTLEVPANYNQTEKGQADLKALFEKKFKAYFDAENGAVLELASGLKYTENQNGVTTGIQGRDIRAFIDDIFDFTAIGFQIPPQLLRANVAGTSDAVTNFLTFCVNVFGEIITDEINRKLYGKEAYLAKTYAKLDTSRIRAVDIKDIANALDVLVRIGSFCVDDCLKILGMEPLNTEWSQARWMTKNYSPIEQAIKGEENSV